MRQDHTSRTKVIPRLAAEPQPEGYRLRGGAGARASNVSGFDREAGRWIEREAGVMPPFCKARR